MSETILPVNSGKQFIDDYRRYSMYILFRRVNCDIRDGLKLVNRRILYAMANDNRAYGNNTVKSASIVGKVIEVYHPHGDTSVYGTMKPMANWFETNIPLIDKQGNFGSFQGDGASAYRYTEAKLSEFASECILGDILKCPESVDWVPTFDGKHMEPEYLPVKVPLLLINGTFGIGLGMKTEVPSHNFNEVMDATIALMRNPNSSITLVPEHSMPCEIIDTDFEDISAKGFGHYFVRGLIEVEQYKGKAALVIKSIPSLVFLDTITDSIEKLVETKKIIQIENCFDESTEEQLRYVIVLKTGADAAYVRDVIYKNTKMQQRVRINLEAIYGIEPVRLSYRAYLLSFIEFRKLTKFRVYNNELQRIQTKIHEKGAYIKVLESGEIDNIINKIRKQKVVNDTELAEYLVSKLKITDLQARFIINSNLRNLSEGYLNKYREEAAQLEIAKIDIMNKISNDDFITKEIIEELEYFKKKYGTPRRSFIVKNSSTANDIPQGEMLLSVTENNYIKKIPINSSFGGTKGDTIKQIIKIDNTDNVLLFDEMGRVFKLPIYKIPFSDKNSNGIDIRFLIKGLTANINTMVSESVIKELSKYEKTPDHSYLVSISKSGYVKKLSLIDFLTVPASGIVYSKVEEQDSIQSVLIARNDLDLIIYSDKKAVRMTVSDIPLLKRNTRGSRGMNSDSGIDGICVIDGTVIDIVIVTEAGKINKIAISALPIDKKSKSGFNVIKLAKNDKIAGIVTSIPNDIIRIGGTSSYTDLNCNDIPYGSSIAAGVKMVSNNREPVIYVKVIK